jgi:RimJ/RimL family protein N-acetyltransferase
VKLLANQERKVIAWAEDWNGGIGRQPDMALGVVDDGGAIVGALLLHKYNPWTWELEVMGLVSNDVAKVFFDGIFVRAGVKRLEVKTTRDNKKVRKAAPRWGFTWDGVRKGYYGPYGDALCWYMTPETCRWIVVDGIEAENACAA